MYMNMGMTYDEFWHGAPEMVISYRKAYRLKLEDMNRELWLQGQYFHDAVAVALSNAFRKRGAQTQKYLEKPYDLFEKTEEEKAAEIRKEREKVQEQLRQMAVEQRRRKANAKQ
jgi:hypothetical protein